MKRALRIPLAVLFVACGDKETDDSAPTDDSQAEAVTFSGDVWPILEANCSSCHSDDTWHPGFKLSDAATAYTAVTTDTPDSGTGAYVVAGDLASSILYDKIANDPPAYGGDRMPAAAPLAAADVETIAAWIEAGAAND